MAKVACRGQVQPATVQSKAVRSRKKVRYSKVSGSKKLCHHTTQITNWIFWIFILEFERTQKPRGLTCCRLRYIDAKSRLHHRAKYGRGGSGISRVTTLTVSPIWIFWRGLNCQIAAHTATAESTHRRLRTQRIRSCQRVFPTIVRSMTVQGSVLVEIRRYEHRSLRSARASPNFEVRSAWGNRAIYPNALYSMW